MRISLKPIREQVIVITGASSGIGLATARAAAKQGARLVLAARNDAALAEVVREINTTAGREAAVHVPVDVGRKEDVERIASTAIERFGGFDTWVNNAGVSIYGRLEEVADEDFQRVFQTNFWGVVFGSLIAVRHLKQRGGALVNLGSVASDTPIPLQGMYSASKHAVKGFTDALRMELQVESAPVSVTLIKPGAINTPYLEHAKNYMEHQPKHAPPVYPASEVAQAILYAAAHPKRDIYVGSSARVMSALSSVAPQAADRVMGGIMPGQQQRAEPARDREGNLHQPGRGGEEDGDQPGYVMRRSYYTWSSMHPALTAALFATAGIAAVALARRNADRPRLGHWMGRARDLVRNRA